MVAFIQNCVDALSLGSLYALAALGIGLLFGMLRLINFAHGDFITIGAFGLIVPSRNDMAIMAIGSLPVVLLVPAACAIVVAAALLSDRLVFRRLRTASAPTLMVASFSVGYIIQNTILVTYGARPKTIDLWSSLGEQLHFGAVRVPRLEVVTIAVTLVLFVSETGTLTNVMGVPLMLYAFIATVVGGMGSLVGAVVGGYTVGFLGVMLQAYLPDGLRSFRDAFVFATIVFVLLLRPAGIIPTKALVQRV
jgi:branched-chain amino acid transport system permease protein